MLGSWAYGMCILSASALMIYLLLLLSIEERDTSKVGSELDVAAAVVAVFLAVMAGTWVHLKFQARKAP